MVAVSDVATAFNAAIQAAAAQTQTTIKGADLNPSVTAPQVTQTPAAGTMVAPGTTVTIK